MENDFRITRYRFEMFVLWKYIVSGETAHSTEPTVEENCKSTESELCYEETCFKCNNIREHNANIVRATILVSEEENHFISPLEALKLCASPLLKLLCADSLSSSL